MALVAEMIALLRTPRNTFSRGGRGTGFSVWLFVFLITTPDIVSQLKSQPLFMCKSHEIRRHAETVPAIVKLLSIHCYVN
jgi:hypothetical protein